MDNPTEWIPRNLSADGMIECTDEHRRDFPQTYVRSEQYNYLASLVRELEARMRRVYGLLQRHYGKADAVMPNELDELEAALKLASPFDLSPQNREALKALWPKGRKSE